MLSTLPLLAFLAGAATASHLEEQPRQHRVVYHLSEARVQAGPRLSPAGMR